MDAQLLDFGAGTCRLRGDQAEILRRRRLWENRWLIRDQRWRMECDRDARAAMELIEELFIGVDYSQAPPVSPGHDLACGETPLGALFRPPADPR